MSAEKKSIKDLQWEEENTFFGIPLENDNPFGGNPNPAPKADDEPGDPPVEKKVTKKEVEDAKFNFGAEDEDEEDGEDEDKTPAKKSSEEDKDENQEEEENEDDEESAEDENEDKVFYTTLATGLKEKGIFQTVDLEGKELKSDEDLYELVSEEVEARINESLEAFSEELDEDGKDFIRFKKAGGKTEDFFAVHRNKVSIGEVDLENEKDQEKIAIHYAMVIEGLDEEEAKDRVEWLKENKKLASKSAKWHEKLEELDQQNKQALIQRAEQEAEARLKNAEKFTTTLKETLNNTEAVGKFKFSPKDKKELGDFIAKPTIKVGKNNFVTPFQKAMADILGAKGENMNKLLVLAKLIKSDFNIEDLEASAKTEVVRESRKTLKNIKSGSKPVTHSNVKRLADFFS